MVSVIIPFYNRVDLLIRAIDSVFRQTFDNWELIMVNDNSTEALDSILKINKGPNAQSVKILHNERNMGPGYSRNIGLDVMNGDKVLFLDSDDKLSDNFLEEMMKIITPNQLFSYSSALWEDGDVYKTSNIGYNKVLPTLLDMGRPWHTSAILWNSKYISRFNEDLKNWEDYLFEFESALNNNNIRHTNQTYVSISNPNDNNLSSREKTIDGYKNRFLALYLMWKRVSFFTDFGAKLSVLLKYLKIRRAFLRDFEIHALKSPAIKIIKFIPDNKLILSILIRLIRK